MPTYTRSKDKISCFNKFLFSNDRYNFFNIISEYHIKNYLDPFNTESRRRILCSKIFGTIVGGRHCGWSRRNFIWVNYGNRNWGKLCILLLYKEENCGQFLHHETMDEYGPAIVV